VKRLDMTHRDDGYIELKSENPSGPNFRISEEDNFQVWGVVVYTIKQWKK
jgi:DNA polymerase V